MKDELIIAGKAYHSRLLVGTGKYKDFSETRAAIDASGAQIVTVAIRRTNIGQTAGEPSLLEYLPPEEFTYLPNTAGCYSAEDAVRTLRLARELLDGHKLVKLEVLGDPKTLFPNVIETIAAAKTLVKDGFDVMVYTSDDPIIAKQLEEIGCCAVMPLASLIGSGMGILNPWNLQIIIDNAKIPVLVDAGIGSAADAAVAMELGCAGVLMNTAIAGARDPIMMAGAMKKAIEAGRESFLAGRMAKKLYSAVPSSPTTGLITASWLTNMAEAKKYAFSVNVQTAYLHDQSSPDDNQYAFAYTVTIHNVGSMAAQLISRHWIITDANNQVHEVKGLGVVGTQPLLQPNQQFEYTSGSVLATPVGSMRGNYQIVAEDGTLFNALIAPFTLAVPKVLN